MKVVHFEILLLGFNDEPSSSELVIGNVTNGDRLESLCFGNRWRLELSTCNQTPTHS
jgi:hypothetical protein